jgi:hypothetical protein
MRKHTPGPWNRGYGNHIYQGARHDPTNPGRLVAICEPSTRTQEDWEEVWANARLIAAAPELLEELEALVEYMILDGYNEVSRTRLPGADKRLARAKEVLEKLK